MAGVAVLPVQSFKSSQHPGSTSNKFRINPDRSTKVREFEDDLSYRGAAGDRRLAFTLSTQDTLDNPVRFWVNPSESQWKVGLRCTIEKISGGAVHHEWPRFPNLNSGEDSKFDQPVISFSFQTGITTPFGYLDIADGTIDEIDENTTGTPTFSGARHVPPGLGNFYDFLQLLHQPNVTAAGQPNYVNILYMSSTFPQIWLQGFFSEEGVQWTDSADNPHAVQSWGASFVVFQSYPALYESTILSNLFTDILSFRTA
jgi:hypothetical protein